MAWRPPAVQPDLGYAPSLPRVTSLRNLSMDYIRRSEIGGKCKAMKLSFKLHRVVYIAALLVVLFVMGLPSHPSSAQSGNTGWDTFDMWNTNGGLSGNSIEALFQDHTGALWFGTKNAGLSRFDGFSWVTFKQDNSGLPANTVSHITEGRDGRLWFSHTMARPIMMEKPGAFLTTATVVWRVTQYTQYRKILTGLCGLQPTKG